MNEGEGKPADLICGAGNRLMLDSRMDHLIIITFVFMKSEYSQSLNLLYERFTSLSSSNVDALNPTTRIA